MSEQSGTAISVAEGENEVRVFARGNALAWDTDFEVSARDLGRRIVDELTELSLPPSDDRVVAIAAELADQEPPLPARLSWILYDGIREALEERKYGNVETAFRS